MNIVSLFSGGGGLDLGFRRLGFNIIWANEYDKDIWDTYKYNHPTVPLNQESITKVHTSIPNCDGMIGGPPCTSWSVAGANNGINDPRGKVFLDYLRIIDHKEPKFFVIENVEGILRKTHKTALNVILNKLENCGKNGYKIQYKLLNAKDYDVPQDRKRVFFIGFRKDIVKKLKKPYKFPDPSSKNICLKDAIYDLRDKAICLSKFKQAQQQTNKTNTQPKFDHVYLDTGWSSQFMSRNRVRDWDEVAYTVPASGRHVTLHPQAPKMVKINNDMHIFKPGSEHLYRRFTIRECARIQTFPDNFELVVDDIKKAYKIIGNAVPVKLAEAIAKSILEVL